jgi:organic radical activating enzyme
MIYLVESFYSFQGEGKYAGAPSVFVRFGGCNLRCFGCDSIRAVERRRFVDSWRKLQNAKELIDEICKITKNQDFKPDIVITGGEPLIYWKDKILYKTIEYFLDLGYRITIETNTTIKIDFKKYPLYRDVVFAMGVKLSNFGDTFKKRVNLDSIENFIKNAKDTFFKFVLDKKMIEEKRAKKEIAYILKNTPKAVVYCMPMGENISQLALNDKAVADFALKYGYNYTDRLHIRVGML